ncbi:MAG TPA: hypothetical protein VGD49_05795 [Longimicrobiales bacterium]
MKLVVVAALLLAANTLSAQTTQAYLAAGDSARSANRMTDALALYEKAVQLDSLDRQALSLASLVAVTLGEFNSNPGERDSLFARATRYARQAVATDVDDAQAHFLLARALGRTALSQGMRERVRFAVEVRNEANAALALKPNHAGARHVLGLWHQNVMQLSRLQRFAARTLLGGKVLGEASWAEAQRNLEASVALEPNAITHRLDLRRFFAVRKQYDQAREQLQWVLAAPSVDYNDDAYRHEADVALKAMRNVLQ